MALLLPGDAASAIQPKPAADPQHAVQAADGPVEALRPGEFLWAPDVAPAGPVMIIVSLTTQRAYAYRNGVPIGVSTISSGKLGHETPTGVFVILQKEIDHQSNIYDNAPMPYMQRLTWSGIAMHAGRVPGYPASHGCIRLPLAFARTLFGITRLGLTVVVTNDATVPETAPLPAVLQPPTPGDSDSAAPFRWQPEKSPGGPVSIVISGRDHRLVVLRNGVEIGSGTVSIDGPVTQTEAFSLKSIDADGAHWFRLPLPGMPAIDPGEISHAEHGRVRLPDAFRRAILTVLQPGATLLVFRGSLKNGSTGKRLPLIEAGKE